MIGDDCAVLRPAPGEDLLVTTDLLVEGVHFRRGAIPARSLGHKTLARGLSDIAAMGGLPRWAFVSVAVPRWANERILNAYYDGLLTLAREHRVQVAGGDLSRSREFTADIVVLGAVPRGKALLRSTARPGDAIYVSGTLGHAAASKYTDLSEPRLALGRWLRARATSCMDLSDGLSLDLHRLCWESRVAADLDADFSKTPPRARRATSEQALHGGEDYELLFTASKKIPSAACGLPLTRIGTIVAGRRGRVTLHGRKLEQRGWDHFRR